MAITDSTDTLAYHNSQVLCSHREISDVTCAHVAQAMKAFMATDKEEDAVPESEALWFYGMNMAWP